jgi:hypothetical protein
MIATIQGRTPRIDEQERGRGQEDERPDHQQLVAEGVHDPAEHAHHAPPPGEQAVDEIGDRRHHEDQYGHVPPDLAGLEDVAGRPIGPECDGDDREEATGEDHPGHGEQVRNPATQRVRHACTVPRSAAVRPPADPLAGHGKPRFQTLVRLRPGTPARILRTFS